MPIDWNYLRPHWRLALLALLLATANQALPANVINGLATETDA